MRSQQDDEEDGYRTQQWRHLERRNGISARIRTPRWAPQERP